MTTPASFLERLPRHDAGLILTHNPHRGSYETVEQYEAWRDCRDAWASPESRAKAIEQDDFWECQWYPYTPVGFNLTLAATLDELLAEMEKP